MLNLFGIDCKTEYVPNAEVGLIYSDSEYAETFAEKRKAGLVAGQPLSALLVNTALRQYCAMSYVFVKAVTDILTNVYGATQEWIDNNLYSSGVSAILSDSDKGFIKYLNNLKLISRTISDGTNVSYYGSGNNDVVVHTALYYEPAGSHKLNLRQTSATSSTLLGTNIDLSLHDANNNMITMVYNAMSNTRNVNRKYTAIRAYTGQYGSSINKPTIADRIAALNAIRM